MTDVFVLGENTKCKLCMNTIIHSWRKITFMYSIEDIKLKVSIYLSMVKLHKLNGCVQYVIETWLSSEIVKQHVLIILNLPNKKNVFLFVLCYNAKW